MREDLTPMSQYGDSQDYAEYWARIHPLLQPLAYIFEYLRFISDSLCSWARLGFCSIRSLFCSNFPSIRKYSTARRIFLCWSSWLEFVSELGRKFEALFWACKRREVSWHWFPCVFLESFKWFQKDFERSTLPRQWMISGYRRHFQR